MKLTGVAAAAAGLAVIALAVPPAASAGPAQEQEFLKILTDNGLTWPSGKDQAIVNIGYAVCQDWQGGATLNSEVDDIKGAAKSAGLGWTDYQVGVLIGASTGEFCPQYKSKIQ